MYASLHSLLILYAELLKGWNKDIVVLAEAENVKVILIVSVIQADVTVINADQTMIRIGKAPFLECSSKGQKEFSAFYARIRKRGNRSIEEIYQAAKVFADGSTGLSWRDAKGKVAVNMQEVAELYNQLWLEYLQENPSYIEFLRQYNGYSDIFGQPGRQCQAVSIAKIMTNHFNHIVQ